MIVSKVCPLASHIQHQVLADNLTGLNIQMILMWEVL